MEASLDVINRLMQKSLLSTDPFLVFALFDAFWYLLLSFWDPSLKSQHSFI